MKPFICTMPMRLDDGWNQIQFNLSDFTRRAYGTNYIETLRVQVIIEVFVRVVYKFIFVMLQICLSAGCIGVKSCKICIIAVKSHYPELDKCNPTSSKRKLIC